MNDENEHILTTWKNPTSKTVKFRLYKGYEGDGKTWARQKPWLNYEVAPGKSVDIPVQYDQAIQTIDVNGIVMGGVAPQLVNTRHPKDVHPSISVGFPPPFVESAVPSVKK